MKEFREKQNDLEDLDQEFENDGEREAFENEYYTAVAAVKALIAAQRRNEAVPNLDISSQTVNARSNAMDKIKLLSIHLPTFNGSYDQWPNFRDTFKAVIDENESLSDIKRFYYLRSSLKGIAAEIIASIEMSADNYEIAWSPLENRFENKRILLHHHSQSLIDFPTIHRKLHTSLRQLLDTTEMHVRALKKLGQPTDHWSILVHLMSAKLDSTTKCEWENKTSSKKVATYEQFINFITNRCIMLETLQLDKLKVSKSSALGSDNKSTATNKRAVAAVATKSKTENCLFCKKSEHKIHHCPAFLNLSLQSRIKEVKALKICINCLREGHALDACAFGTCRLCTKKHNILLHLIKSEVHESNNINRSQTLSDSSSQATESQATTSVHCATLSTERGMLAGYGHFYMKN